MSQHDHEDCDHESWDGVPTFVNDGPIYTLRVLDFIGIGLNGMAPAVGGLGNGLHYILQVSAREFFQAAAGQRQRDHEAAERRRLEEYAASFDASEIGD